MEFTIKEYERYEAEEILNLYAKVGWTNYTDNPVMLENAYHNSLKILGAYKGEELLGIVRVVGDGHSIIFVQDILVLPEYQRKGIGRALLQAILDMYPNVYQKSLMTDNTEKTIRFYKSLGFEMDTDIECRAFIKVY
ncbi:MAG: GNAT family N-acetyltransferase [Lachnospiraceae bacterium]|nr:GNAT family N-acetyltransferase [Lachnospiraceae bacterium]